MCPAMTTQSPHGSYPTSPPWAQQQQQQPPPPPAAPWGPEAWSTHGRLLVPYPEEIARANRSKPPSWVPVVIWTLLFGVLAFPSARRRARKALIGRNDRYPYWIAYGATVVVGSILSVLLWLSVGVPAYLEMREQALNKAVAGNLVGTGAVREAACEPLTDAVHGVRTYTCAVTATNGKAGTLKVKADDQGVLQPR